MGYALFFEPEGMAAHAQRRSGLSSDVACRVVYVIFAAVLLHSRRRGELPFVQSGNCAYLRGVKASPLWALAMREIRW